MDREIETTGPEEVNLIPDRMNIGYLVTPAGAEAVAIHLETANLGEFNVLIALESAPVVADQIHHLCLTVDDYRRDWAAIHGQP